MITSDSDSARAARGTSVPKSIPLALFALVCLVAALLAAHASDSTPVEFAGPAAIIDLKDHLSPYHAPSGTERDGSSWYMLTVANNSVRPSTRVLLAGQPIDAPIRFWPLRARPAILQVAASDSQVIVEDARAHARHAFRVTIPPATTATLAIRVANGDVLPSIIAWTEPALVSHNRQLSVFVAAVIGMIAAAMAITMGLAVMTAHPAPIWASVLLVMIFALRLAVTGTLDWSAELGGPYGLEIALAGFALVVGLKLTDVIVPFDDQWPGHRRFFQVSFVVIALLAALAYIGIPGAMMLTDIVILLGTTAITLYFLYRGRNGDPAARVAAPSAAVFALVAWGTAVVAIGGIPDSQALPSLVEGITAAGAVLLALAVAAGEGIAALPASRYGTVREASAEPLSYDPTGELAADPAAATNLEVLAISASHQGVFDLNFQNETVTLSAEAAPLIGMSGGPTTMPHPAWIDRIHPDDRATYREAIGDYSSHTGIAFRIEFRVRSESGRYPWLEVRATMMGEGMRADRCLGLVADVTARKEDDAAASERSTRDALTGLGNRVALMQNLERLGSRLSGVTFALLDIDRFKSVHASIGDQAADQVLAGLAQRLIRRFGKSADVFRVSGDAFALTFGPSAAGAATVGADLVDACAAPFQQHERNIFATASVGVASGRDARDPLDLLKNAELALMQAKRQGGACAKVYTPALESASPGDAVALEADLRQALKENQLDLYYQPIVRLSDGSIAGFEGLMRWQHPQRGLIEPANFIAHCEETGLIVALGRLALERAVSDLAQWQRFFPLEPPLSVSVNLSRRQLLEANLESYLKGVLDKSGLKPGSLKLEVTESSVTTGNDTRQVLQRLKAAGARLAIDDFGTGVSNFNQLKEIPFDTVKLDQSFLGRDSETPSNSDSTVIIGSIIKLAHDLGRDVVIEGVETQAEAEWLRGLGCEYAQGFYFSAPLPRTEALDFIARHYRAETGQA